MSSDYYGHIAGEIADSGGNPMFDRMTDGEIAHYLEDRDYEPACEPPADWYEAEAERYAQIHRDKDHGGGECDCPVAEPEYSTEAPF